MSNEMEYKLEYVTKELETVKMAFPDEIFELKYSMGDIYIICIIGDLKIELHCNGWIVKGYSPFPPYNYVSWAKLPPEDSLIYAYSNAMRPNNFNWIKTDR